MEFVQTLIRASAGTGKTFQLSNRYISLLLNSQDPASILAATFTRKAAGEILDRILSRLAKASLTEEDAAELCKELKQPILPRKQFGASLKALVTNLHRLHVGTLDSYFSQLLSNHAFEFHLGTDWRIMTAVEISHAKTSALASLVASENHDEVAKLMHLIHKGRHKRSVFREIDHAIADLLPPFYQTTVTAWAPELSLAVMDPEDLEQAICRLEEEVESDPAQPFQATIHSDIAKVRGQLWDDALGGGLFKKVADGETTFSRKEIPSPILNAYAPLIKHVAGLKAREVRYQTEATQKLLSKFTKFLDQHKLANGLLEFGDVARLLTSNKTQYDSSYRMDTKLEHLLLDEFQDTSVAQWNVLEPLAHSIAKGRPALNSFFCVGDVKQAIYGWRGGRREIFDRLSSTLPDLFNDQLTESYRSSPVIIDFVNLIFANLTNHPNMSNHGAEIQQWQEGFISHQAHYEFPGFVEYINAKSDRVKSVRDEHCLEIAVSKVQELLSTNHDIQIGLLVRDNESIARLIQMLGEQNILASEEGGNPLSRYSAVQLIISVLKLADHPGDTTASYHVTHSPLADYFKLTDHQDQNAVLRMARKLRSDVGRIGLGACLYQLVCEMESYVDKRQFDRLLQLSRFADHYQFVQPLRFSEFISAIENERFADPLTSRVRVMTIHQSKGLEFDVVILPTLDSLLAGRSPQYALSRNNKTQAIDHVYMYRSSQIQQLLPPKYRAACESAVAERVTESLCVLYVAITRASRALYMIGPCKDSPPKTVPLTSAGIIQCAATADYSQQAEHVVFQHGDPNWFEDRSLILEKNSRHRAVLPTPFAVVDPGGNSQILSASPSSLEGGTRLKLSGILRTKSHKALATGTELHAYMELLEWFTPEAWSRAEEIFRSKFGEISPSLGNHLATMDKGGDLNRILTQSFYYEDPTSPLAPDLRSLPSDQIQFEVHNEYPICALIDDHLMRGYIDRLVLFKKEGRVIGADIVDFKTDYFKPGSSELSQRISHYRPQLIAYRKAISQMHQLSQSSIGSRLLFTVLAEQAVIPPA